MGSKFLFRGPKLGLDQKSEKRGYHWDKDWGVWIIKFIFFFDLSIFMTLVSGVLSDRFFDLGIFILEIQNFLTL